jgi:hypothetical protein
MEPPVTLMNLSLETNYPVSRRYVLKLHRAAAPGSGRLLGRLENLSSGRHGDFESAEQLLALLAGALDDSAGKTPAR